MDLQIPRGFSSLIPAGEQGELRAQLNRDRRIMLLSGTPVVNLRSEVSGVSARVCRGGSYGFASAPGHKHPVITGWHRVVVGVIDIG